MPICHPLIQQQMQALRDPTNLDASTTIFGWEIRTLNAGGGYISQILLCICKDAPTSKLRCMIDLVDLQHVNGMFRFISLEIVTNILVLSLRFINFSKVLFPLLKIPIGTAILPLNLVRNRLLHQALWPTLVIMG